MTLPLMDMVVCSIIVAVVRKFVLLLPLIFIVPMFVSNQTMGVYMAEPIGGCDRSDIHGEILFSIQFKR